MSPEDAAFLKGVIGFVLLTSTLFGAYWMRLKGKMLTPRDDSALLDLREEQARLRAEMDARVAELEERVEFAERRLVQERQPRLRAEPPAVSTPV